MPNKHCGKHDIVYPPDGHCEKCELELQAAQKSNGDDEDEETKKRGRRH